MDNREDMDSREGMDSKEGMTKAWAGAWVVGSKVMVEAKWVVVVMASKAGSRDSRAVLGVQEDPKAVLEKVGSTISTTTIMDRRVEEAMVVADIRFQGSSQHDWTTLSTAK